MDLTEPLLRARLRDHEPQRAPTGPSTAHAAVAVVMRRAEELEVLLIHRASHPGDPWSGHMAFPGGRQEDGDADLLATAVREAAEEVGLDLRAQAELIGQLDDQQAVSRARLIDLWITPYVFVLHEAPALRPDPAEVEATVWAPLSPLFSGAAATTRPYEHDGVRLELPAWQVGPHVVWGLTHRMLYSLFDLCRSGRR